MGVPYPSRSQELVRDIIIMTAVTFPVIILRFVSRSLVSNRLGLDDLAVAVAAVRVIQRKFYGMLADSLNQLIMIPMAIIPIFSKRSQPIRYFTKSLPFQTLVEVSEDISGTSLFKTRRACERYCSGTSHLKTSAYFSSSTISPRFFTSWYWQSQNYRYFSFTSEFSSTKASASPLI